MANIKGGGFAAVGLDGLVMTSADGREWQEKSLGDGISLQHVCFGDGRCVVAGKHGATAKYAASSDGSSWRQGDGEKSYTGGDVGIFHFKGKFFAVSGDGANAGDNKPRIASSSDGVKWSGYESISGKRRFSAFASNGNIIVAAGDKGRRAWSNDGMDWKDDEGARPLDTMISMAYGNGIFVGSGLHGMRMTTKDGKSWSSRIDGEEGEHINSMLWTGEQFVGVGLGATYFSPDGLTWSRQPNENAPTCATYGNGLFVGVRWKGRILVSKDALRWEESHRGPNHLEKVVFGPFGG